MTLQPILNFKKAHLLFFLLLTTSCSVADNSSKKASWNLSDGVVYPEGGKLSRPEHGVMLADGTLIVADQRYGLAKIDLFGKVSPFGNFEVLDFEHNPPKVESAPNGVHLTPDKEYIITADVFNGKIYKTSIKTKSTEIIYSHKYGANAAREDSTGSVWFTQSTENQNEERLFMALDEAIPDGALYRIPISQNGIFSKPELILKNLYFANGFFIDEKRNKLYLSEMMKNRILSFDLDILTGAVSNQTTLAVIPTPDNMELNSDGKLWVSSPLSNQIFSVDLENGESYIVFDAQTQMGLEIMEEAIRRMESGEGFAQLLTPELTGEMPGLLTGLIVGDESQPFYVANLGTALIKVSRE